MSDIKICITGGSGFIGTTAMDWSISKYETKNFDICPPKKIEHHPFWKYVDIRDYDSFNNALFEFKPTHIIHLAAMTGMEIYDMNFFEANITGVANLIQASRNIPSLERIIFTSSLLVCPNGHVPSSDTEYNPPNLYGESKVIGEKIVRESEMNCSWIIVRPTSIWGPWFEHSYRKFFTIIDRGLFVQPGRKKIFKPQSFVGNTVYMIQKLLFNTTTIVEGQTYYLGDYPEISIQDWANKIRNLSGRKGKAIVFPALFLWSFAYFGDFLKKLGWKDPTLTTFRYKNLLTGAHYPIEKTKNIVGQLPFTTEKGVNETIKWMRKEKII